jgi:isopenicillin-N epimerase
MTSTERLRRHWTLDPSIVFLNQGGFGACPRPVLEAQQAWRARIEADPVRYMLRELEPALDAARAEVGRLIGADPEDFAFTTNATTAVNTVAASLELAPGDEILTTDHDYVGSRNALLRAAERSGARVVVAAVPFPVSGADEVVAAVLAGVTPRTRLAMIDHVTSATGLVLPVERLVAELGRRGVDCLVDGAHAPGMVPLDLDRLGAAYYAGNFHKWICAPKGAGLLWARRDKRDRLRPPVASVGATSTRTERTRFRLEFDWTGTHDPTPFLCVPDAIRFLSGLLPGGLPALMAANRAQALAMRARLAAKLGAELPCPDAMIGALASIPLPDAPPGARSDVGTFGAYPALYAALVARGFQASVFHWPAAPRRLLRISSQVYNTPDDYERLGDALVEELARERTA